MDNQYQFNFPEEHMVVIYDNENEIINILINYISLNLKNNYRCFYITGDTNTNLFLQKLKNSIDYRKYLNKNQLVILNKEDLYVKDGTFSPDKMIDLLIRESRTAVSDGYNGLAITGEISWALEFNDGFEKILEYEWKLNEKVFSEYPVSSICRYNLNKFTNEMIKNIIQVHPYIIWKDKVHENPFYIPIEGFKENNLAKYQVITWLNNISKFTSVKSNFRDKIIDKETALVESEEKFKYVFNNSPIAKSLTSPSGEINVNNTFCKMLGYTKEELQGELWERITHPEDIERSKKEFSDLLSNNKNKSRFIKRYIHKDGSIIWTELHVSLRKDKNGKPLYFITSIIDITEQKKYENDLLNTKENFKLMFEDAPLPYQSLDENGNFISVNRAWLELLGYELEEVIGKNFGDFIHSDFKEHFKINFPKFKYEGVTCTKFEMLKKDGSIRIVSFNGRIGHNPDGSFRQTHCIMQDITDIVKSERILNKAQAALKESEERYRSLFEHSGLGIGYYSPEGDIISYNNQAASNMGGKPEDFNGKNIFDLFPKEVANVYFNRIVKALESDISQTYEDYVPETIPPRYYISTYLRVLNSQGDVVGVQITSLDITEQKEAEKNLFYLSYHDQLTNLYNRRFFEEELKRLDTDSNLPLSLIMADVNGLKLVNDSFGHNIGDELLKKAANVISNECKSNDILARLGGDEFILILPKTNLYQANKFVNKLQKLIKKEKINSVELSLSFGYDTKITADQNILDVLISAENFMYNHKVYESSSMHSKTVDIILNALYEKSNRELKHSKRVSIYCELLAKAMEMDRDEVNQIKTAGLLHDIGKIGIDESILNKSGKLTENEWEKMKKHPESSWRILIGSDEFSSLAECIRQHHERWDGKGYPMGLKSDNISIEARIIAIADAYDAMTSKRTYKDAMSIEEAIYELQACKGNQFDPDIVDVFIEKVLKKKPYIQKN